MSVPRAFVSLTYDDALSVHHEQVAPLLSAHGLRGTFYVPCTPALLAAADVWRAVAAAGHELGNHTLFHPCDTDGGWLDPAYHLRTYNARRWNDEVALANAILRQLDGRAARSFGNTCHQDRIGLPDAGLTVESLAPAHFVAARGVRRDEPITLPDPRWFNLGTRGIDRCDFAELRPQLEALIETGGWCIYTMHGVGPRDHPSFIDETEHRLLIEWLAARRELIHTAPVRDIAEALKA